MLSRTQALRRHSGAPPSATSVYQRMYVGTRAPAQRPRLDESGNPQDGTPNANTSIEGLPEGC